MLNVAKNWTHLVRVHYAMRLNKSYTRLYSLYYRNRVGGKRWCRATQVSLTKLEAIRHWTDRIIFGLQDSVREYRIRPID